ncbi:glycosyltransferase family 2 protein [Pediococcus pentosaceus]|nr:glycosyltransferase family 2 protein [Pediococcus pentosaceus]
MISVCMATYNGEKFIRQQLSSILSQLELNDEVIIVDDVSKDGTVGIIRGFEDERIKLISNSHNIGPVKSFEKALWESKGDIIFLSDQDDVWMPNKVGSVVSSFNKNNSDLVVHDATVTDIDLKSMADSWNRYNKNKFVNWIMTLVKNPFTGANMAFNRRVLNRALPFPTNIPMHDWWIGIVCQKLSMNIDIIHKPLILYRRHGNNVTGGRHELKKMFVNRLHLYSDLSGVNK